MACKTYNKGFTLIEISIVIVIISLIVSGVLVGRDLIESAAIRSQVGQFEKFGLGVGTFRVKYNGMPGDLKAAAATSFGFTDRSAAGYDYLGNNYIESCAVTGSRTYFGCEAALFWQDLSMAKMINENFSATINNANIQVTSGQQSQYVPVSKLSNDVYTLIMSESPPTAPWTCSKWAFCFFLTKFAGTAADGSYTGGHTPGLNAMRAYALDSKLDDGFPNTGRVLAYGGAPCNDSSTYLTALTLSITPCSLYVAY